ncbi:MAG TPA: hypothetical protein VFC38_11080 [Stellaceae bacterium]|nr:hypothetical protein [Stellaceae bacterium]
MPSPVRILPYAALLLALWMTAMTVRLYPQFKDTLRVDDRLVTVNEYIEDTCDERLGPTAGTCLAEAAAEAQILLRREQAKSILLILGPAVLYLIYLPLAAAARSALRRGGAKRKP